MSILNPAYKFTIGNQVVDTSDEPQASTLVALTVKLDMDTPADAFQLVLGNVGELRPSPEDEASIELASSTDESLTQVAAGTVLEMNSGLGQVHLSGYSAARTLLRGSLEETFESKTAGQIVTDLAARVNVTVATAEDGIEFPAYVIDGRQSFYAHMNRLASLCGFDLYFNAENQLVFKKFIGGETVHVLEYAKHILALDVRQTQAHAGTVEAWGESPGGGAADEAWAWLTKDFSGSKGDAGSGDPTLLLERPALRTGAAAASAADAAAETIRRSSVRGRLVTWGQPSIRLGDAIRVRDAPAEISNDSFQVRAVTHRFTKTGGFTTTVALRSI